MQTNTYYYGIDVEDIKVFTHTKISSIMMMIMMIIVIMVMVVKMVVMMVIATRILSWYLRSSQGGASGVGGTTCRPYLPSPPPPGIPQNPQDRLVHPTERVPALRRG